MKNSTKILATSVVLLVAAALGRAAPASENWDNLCAKCHGPDGKGQTKIGKKLNLRDYTSAAVQAELKDTDMLKAIVDGVKDKDGKEKMKAFKGDISEAEAKDLVAYIRKFKA